MKKFAEIIINNRTTTTAMKKENLDAIFVDSDSAKENFKNWKSDVEALRLSVSNYAVLNRVNADSDSLSEAKSDVFSAYKKVLAWLRDDSIDLKLGCQATDIETLLTFVGANRKASGSTDGRDFLPVGPSVFRKALEDFISDRMTARVCKTAAEIEAEKATKRAEKKAHEKARKLAEKEKKENQLVAA